MLIMLVAACSKNKDDVMEDIVGPEAYAGRDTILYLPKTSFTLDGSQSKHPRGTITSFQWTQIDGLGRAQMANSNAATTLVDIPTRGIYQFELKVTDTRAKSDRDTIKVNVHDSILKENAVLLENLSWECPWGCGIIIKNFKALLPPQKKLTAVYYRDAWHMPWQLVLTEAGSVKGPVECVIAEDDLWFYDVNEIKYGQKGDVALIYQ
jgi:hypothetical protein